MANSYDKCIESDLPIVSINGLNTNKDADFRGALGVSGAATLAGAIAAGSTISAVGAITADNATAISAAGVLGVGFSNVATLGVYFGSGAPTGAAATGSLYLNYTGSGTGNRLYVAAGGTAWAVVTTTT